VKKALTSEAAVVVVMSGEQNAYDIPYIEYTYLYLYVYVRVRVCV